MRKTYCLLPVICLLAACDSIRYVGIETYNPSDVTYPKSVRKVLIVNNALPQPPDTGYEFNFFGQPQDTCRANADSALFDACRSLGVAIAGTNFFDDVLLFHEGTRKDSFFLEDARLTREDVTSLCKETGTDAVISLDRLLFETKKKVTAYREDYLTGSIDVEMKGILRSYLPGRTNPVITITMSDSVSFFEEAYSPEMLSELLPTTDDALRISGGYIGGKMHQAFVPHWKNELRWYFTGPGARWKEAAAYASGGKWEKAAERWQYIYDHTQQWSNRAKSAASLALCYEIAGDFEKALEWAKVSSDLFGKNKGKGNSHTQKQELYITTLEKRIMNDRKLNLQIRDE
ncbi:MAG: tetratricopeptide repeat protein [Tannerellaceae bacterium]|jgi:hypothetical protein|nr:tetratricopeptide repeat protein [Tannerellaceae bacterium]